jgi:NtrC-family two-component system sensor histidine kinase KinB
MTLTLRARIFLTLLPLLALLVVVGTAGALLLYHLGGRIDAILRENYNSVIYMERLNEALERIDSSFQFALAGREDQARRQFDDNWPAYRKNLDLQYQNITLPREQELTDRLAALTTQYRKKGDAFYRLPAHDPQREQDYFAAGGLLDLFKEIKAVSGEISRINHDNMVDESKTARQAAVTSLTWFGVGLVLAAALAIALAWRVDRSILHPVRALTESALGISAGNLHQVVPVVSRDELGQLAEAFNRMAHHLRDYRQSHSAQLLRAQRTSQATIDSFPDPVLVVDADGAVEMANPAAQRLLGVVPRKPGLQAGAPWQPVEALRGPLAEALQGHKNYLPEGFDRAIALGSDGRGGSYLPRILTIHDPYGNSLGAAILLQDVTRFRLLDQFKTDLVATVSHELKTPLTSLRLDLHLVLEEKLGPLTSKQMELLLDARDNAERLLAIVNNLLDLARLQQRQGEVELRPVAPLDLVQGVADAVRPRVEDKGIELVVDVPPDLPEVSADPARLRHALENLLDNAITYTDRGGRITLAAAPADDRVAISVADTGIGIPAEHLCHIFERFFRVPGQSRGTGTGLGLAIAREIVTAHGGSITCESRPGTGTVFRITLPVWKQQPAKMPNA